jgi:hypothetical protein
MLRALIPLTAAKVCRRGSMKEGGGKEESGTIDRPTEGPIDGWQTNTPQKNQHTHTHTRQVKVHVRVWSLAIDGAAASSPAPGAPAEEGPAAETRVHVVSVQRKAGDPVLFHRVYRAIRAKVCGTAT